MPALITKKRDGVELSQAEIEYFIKGVVEGEVQGSQLGRHQLSHAGTQSMEIKKRLD